MLALGLRLDLPVSRDLVEDDHHARGLEDGVFRHLVAVTVHVTFVYRCRHTDTLCLLTCIYSKSTEVDPRWWCESCRHCVVSVVVYEC